MAYKLKILVVENEATTLRQLEAALKALGAEPHCFGKSPEAAKQLNKEKFDGAFLSWDLPEVSGEQLTKLLRNSRSNAKIPIAMLTAHTDSKALGVGFKAGVTFFLSKPVGPKELGRLLGATRGAMQEERLRYQRVPLKAPVVVAWEDKKVTGQGVDLSVGGVLVALEPESGKPAPGAGTEVTVEMTLGRAQGPLSLKGTVARVSPDQQAGIKFFRLTAEQKEALKSYVDRHVGGG